MLSSNFFFGNRNKIEDSAFIWNKQVLGGKEDNARSARERAQVDPAKATAAQLHEEAKKPGQEND